MSDRNGEYQEALKTIDALLARKDYSSAKEALDALYQFKPVRLTWFVRKARFAWLTEGVESAREILKEKFVLNYCYEGIPEALELMAEMELQQGNALERERILCAMDLALNYGTPETVYHSTQQQLEEFGKEFWESGSSQSAHALWEKSYVVSDAIEAIVVQHYLRQFDAGTFSVPWIADFPNIQYVKERLEEEKGGFIILAENENQWQSAALAKMLRMLGKCVYLLRPSAPFQDSIQKFFDESGKSCIQEARNLEGVTAVNTYYIQQNGQVFDNRHLIMQELIDDGGALFTVLGSGCLMDDVALAGDMKKHFERFNLQLGDMFDTNFSAGWVGDYVKYLEKIYDMDVNAHLNAQTTCKFSIVIPARNSAATLRYTVQTCLEQDFPADDYEIIISDNSIDGNHSVYDLCCELSDPRIHYIKTPRSLALGRSFEFAFLHTKGEFVLSLGSDDGLLPWALRILDKIRTRFPKENIIQWERGFYAWPGFNGTQENQFVIPRDYKKVFQPVFYRSCEYYLHAAAQNPQFIYGLPLLYINSGFRRDYMKVLLGKTGRMWDGGAQDIYIGFVNVLIHSSILNLQYPLSIAGMSSGSIGAVANGNRGSSENRKAINTAQNGSSISLSTFSLPEKLSAPGASDASIVTRFIYRCVSRGLISFEEVSQIFDMRNLFAKAANSVSPVHEQKEQNLRASLYAASFYGEDFYHWYDETVFKPTMIPRKFVGNPIIPKYQEGKTADGGEVLDASKYDVENILQAVHLFVDHTKFSPEAI